jgi:hypothetical protein
VAGDAMITVFGTSSGNRIVREKPDGVDVEQVTVKSGDEFARAAGMEHASFVKIDTEGFDLVVLRGFSDMLREQRIDALQVEVSMGPQNRKHVSLSAVQDYVSSRDTGCSSSTIKPTSARVPSRDALMQSLFRQPASLPTSGSNANTERTDAQGSQLGSSMGVAFMQSRTGLGEPRSHSMHWMGIRTMRTGKVRCRWGEALETRRVHLDPGRDFHARCRAFKHQRAHFGLLNERVDLAFKQSAQVSGRL